MWKYKWRDFWVITLVTFVISLIFAIMAKPQTKPVSVTPSEQPPLIQTTPVFRGHPPTNY